MDDDEKPLIVRQMGGPGNRLFQYLFCEELAKRSGHAVMVTDLDIPLFDLFIPKWSRSRDGFLHIEGKHTFDADDLANQLRDPDLVGATFRGFAMRLEYYDLHFCRRLLARRLTGDAEGFGPDHLVINVRAGEIVAGIHKDYRPLPLSYFEKLITTTGLKPVFVGQVDTDTEYGAALVRRFPQAEIVPHQSPKHDFLTLMRSRNVAIAIGSFSWLAAWLSRADTIHLPIAGLFDPQQRHDVDLIPRNDPRYVLHELPQQHWRGTPEQLAELYAS